MKKLVCKARADPSALRQFLNCHLETSLQRHAPHEAAAELQQEPGAPRVLPTAENTRASPFQYAFFFFSAELNIRLFPHFCLGTLGFPAFVGLCEPCGEPRPEQHPREPPAAARPALQALGSAEPPPSPPEIARSGRCRQARG